MHDDERNPWKVSHPKFAAYSTACWSSLAFSASGDFTEALELTMPEVEIDLGDKGEVAVLTREQ